MLNACLHLRRRWDGVLSLLLIFTINYWCNLIFSQASDERRNVPEKEIGVREFWELPRYPRPDRLFDWGGWLRTNFYSDSLPPVEEDRSYMIDELKLWFNLDYKGSHTLYGRFQERLTFFDNRGDALGSQTTDWFGPKVDVFYYKFNKSFTDKTFSDNESYFTRSINMTIGRKYFYLGSGIVLFNKLDGVEFNLRMSQYLTINVFLAQNIKTNDDFDFLRPNASRSERFFTGIEFSTAIFSKNPVSVYFLKQFDRNKDRFVLPGQDFLYDSWYLGVYATGKLFLPELTYSVEFIYEGGKSSSKGVKGVSGSISAWANVIKLEYLPSKFISKIFLNNYWASGDADRKAPRTSALGSAPGTTDSAFGYFGFVPLGLAFFPYFSNIITTSSGFVVKPVQDETSMFRNLTIGVTAYLYHKDKKGGGIFDSLGATATAAKKFLGTEVDAFINWRLLSDFSLTSEYGVFFPSSAFATTKSRTFFVFGFLYEF